ncbi:MAG: protein kinase [Lachnospiraceae bacterium]|nr:protein kinase [Lachnospiraceae bacterium]
MINKGVRLNNRYVIDRAIGEGGGGVVYRAFDSNLQNYVVVKQIKESASSLLESRAEADILKGLKHENLPKVLDFFEAQGRVFTVIDFIEGVSLADGLKARGWFGQKEVLMWARQLSRALAYLHSQYPPIIHSDIKPGNIMWNGKTGKVCLIDFNISLAFHKGQKSVTWLSGGYSPPEQYRSMEQYGAYLTKVMAGTTKQGAGVSSCRQAGTGQAGASTKVFDRRAFASLEPVMNCRVDERSDVYSFGATLYHLLTGRKPDVNFLSIVPISAYQIPLSEGFCHIIEKCMELSPERRYQNGIQLNEAFEHIYELDSEYRGFWRRRFWGNVISASMMAGGLLMAGGGLLVKDWEDQIRYQAYVQEAESFLEDGDYEEALAQIEKAGKIDGNRVDADELKLLVLYREGRYEECIWQGFSLLGKKQYRLKDEKDRARLGNLYYIMGCALLEQEQEEDAVSCLEEALEYEEENPDFYREYAIALARCNKTDKAGKVLEKARKMDLDSDSIAFAAGEIAYAGKAYEEAEEKFLKVLKETTDPRLRERAVLMVNRTYVQQGKDSLDKAIAMLEEETGKKENWQNKRLLEALAADYLMRAEENGSQEDRIKALNQYVALYDSGDKSLRVMGNLGILYREAGKVSEAQQIGEQMLDQYPEDYQGHKLLAFLELDKQQQRENSRRNYQNFQICYENARKLYDKQKGYGDEEMDFLGQMDEDLRKGGWY